MSRTPTPSATTPALLAAALALGGVAAWLAPRFATEIAARPALAASAAGLSVLPGATLVRGHPANDGDSFVVKANGKQLHLRLYYVDTLEIRPCCPKWSMTKRMWHQARYFGLLQEPGEIMRFGKQAGQYMERVLAEPFTVYTEYEKVMSSKRVYGFVKTHSGEYLYQLLVAEGLARIYGKPRQNPDGLRDDAVLEQLRRLEVAAQRARSGIWQASDWQQVARTREQQRIEDRELDEFAAKLEKSQAPHRTLDAPPLDLNLATRAQLETIKGIGPKLAARIIAERPYRSTEELLKVQGIGRKTLRKIEPYVTVVGN